ELKVRNAPAAGFRQCFNSHPILVQDSMKTAIFRSNKSHGVRILNGKHLAGIWQERLKDDVVAVRQMISDSIASRSRTQRKANPIMSRVSGNGVGFCFYSHASRPGDHD